jgi:hypothetical protein
MEMVSMYFPTFFFKYMFGLLSIEGDQLWKEPHFRETTQIPGNGIVISKIKISKTQKYGNQIFFLY